MFKVPEMFRLTKGPYASDASYGNNGAFFIPTGIPTADDGEYDPLDYADEQLLVVIASDGAGWEHVSVHVSVRKPNRQGQFVPHHDETPSWEEMCSVKDLFWGDDDCVVQFHPPKKEYVNDHENCLHLWRPVGYNIMTPSSILVGLKK